MMNSFGAGWLAGRAAATTANPTPTPRVFGQLQDVSVGDSFDEKKLFGQNSAPLRGFRGQRKIDIKAKAAQISGQIFAEIYHGQVAATGATLPYFGFIATIPTTPFQVTIAPPSSGTFAEDFGVNYAASPFTPLKLVASGPTQGQYAVNSATGIYTFAAADTAAQVVINYTYAIATGISVSVNNNVQQESPYFEVYVANPQDGGYAKKFFKCSSSKLSMDFKQGDIVIPEFDISAFDPGTGVIYIDNFASV
jgi:hypothetical protein